MCIRDSVGTADFVTIDKAALYTDANYRPYMYSNTDPAILVDSKLKPTLREELALTFRRNFENGGNFRSTAVLSRIKDQYYYRGVNELQAAPQTVNGTTYAIAPTYYRAYLEVDPDAIRTHRGLEFEFNFPLYRDARQSLTFSGNWTVNRDFGTNTYRDNGDGDPSARFDSYMLANGVSKDRYNPYGELQNSIRNVAKAWLTYIVSSKNGVQNVVTLLGGYESGAPYSIGNAYTFPGTTFLPNQATNAPVTSWTMLHGDRGGYRNPEYFSADLQWNLTVPLSKKVRFTSYLMVSNLFNTVLQTSMNQYGWDGNPLPYGNGTGLSYRAHSKSKEMLQWGLPNYSGRRTFTLDLGLKF